jgi:TolA-binding protein
MFLERFPSHPRASEAQFWIGDCLYKSGRYGDAIAAYQRVIRNWPGSSMEPEAAAKIGYSYYNLQDFRTAAQALQIVVDRYPYYGQIERVREHLAVLQRAVGAR